MKCNKADELDFNFVISNSSQTVAAESYFKPLKKEISESSRNTIHTRASLMLLEKKNIWKWTVDERRFEVTGMKESS